ncbi:MAG: GspH/FimT family pseudopilin [Halieaceae bacterium]|nr:GspH/FimT family pseudopilin [Halieaceae bacterium]
MRQAGLTLIEILITLTILSILLGVMPPLMSSLVVKIQTHTTVRSFSHHLHWARAEAIARFATVGVCPLDPENISRCGHSYSQGWLIFHDVNHNRRYGRGDVLLKVKHMKNSGLEFKNRAGTRLVNRTIWFKGNGVSGSAMTLVACIDILPRKAAGLVLNNIGRISIRSHFSACTKDQ